MDVNEITRAVNEEQEASSGGSFKMLFQNNKQRFMYRTLLGMGGQAMQQLSGINLITYVSITKRIFQQKQKIANITSMPPSFLNSLLECPITQPYYWQVSTELRTSSLLWSLSGQSSGTH